MTIQLRGIPPKKMDRRDEIQRDHGHSLRLGKGTKTPFSKVLWPFVGTADTRKIPIVRRKAWLL